MPVDWKAMLRPGPRLFWLGLLLVFTGVYWFGYVRHFGPTQDPDPDGYVTHARGLQQTGGLITHHRLPGYPAFILLCDVALPGPIATNVYWVQGVLGWGFGVAVLLMLSRMRSGSLGGGRLEAGQWLAMGAGIGFVVLSGLNNFWGLFTSTMMSNFLGSLLAGMVAAAFWLLWEKARKPWTRGLGLAGLLLGIFGSVVVHPVNYMVLALLVPAVLSAWFLLALAAKCRGNAWSRVYGRYLPKGVWLWRAVLLAGVFLAAAGSRNLSYVLLDRPDPEKGRNGSSRRFSDAWLAHQMLLRLPPAEDTPVERAIEAMKDKMSAERGWRVERVAMPPFYPDYQHGRTAIEKEFGVDVSDSKIWKRRLLANPGAGVKAAAEELLHKYHVLIRQSLPAKYYWDVYPDNNTNPFPPDNNSSLRRRLFWNYGIDLLHYRNIKDDTKEKKVWKRAKQEIAYVAVGILLPLAGLGVALRFSRVPGVFLTGFFWMLGYLAALAFCGFINGRYFLPFFPYLYVLQGLGAAGILLGLMAIVRWALRFRFRERGGVAAAPGS